MFPQVPAPRRLRLISPKSGVRLHCPGPTDVSWYACPCGRSMIFSWRIRRVSRGRCPILHVLKKGTLQTAKMRCCGHLHVSTERKRRRILRCSAFAHNRDWPGTCPWWD